MRPETELKLRKAPEKAATVLRTVFLALFALLLGGLLMVYPIFELIGVLASANPHEALRNNAVALFAPISILAWLALLGYGVYRLCRKAREWNQRHIAELEERVGK